MLRRETASFLPRHPQPPFSENVLCLPPPISKKLLLFEPPKQKKFEKLFSLLTTFGKKPPVLNERKLKIQRKKPRKSSACGKSAIRRLIFRAYFYFVHSDPRPPNFAEIHARGRRGRLEFDHRDLIPPWGHEHFFREEEKPSIPVSHDRNGDTLPSRQTGTVDKVNDGRTGHGRDKANSLRSIL